MRRRGLVWVLAGILPSGGTHGHSDVDVQAQDIARTLAAIEKKKRGLTPADLSAAQSLNAEGAGAYRKRRYGVAFNAYMNSYPNHPNAYAYIMSGDPHWRAVVQHHEKATAGASKGHRAGECSLDNRFFASDLLHDLARHHLVGLALAERDDDQEMLRSSLYRRARESAACLQDLARQYESQAPSACVDVDKLRACLGRPLIDQG